MNRDNFVCLLFCILLIVNLNCCSTQTEKAEGKSDMEKIKQVMERHTEEIMKVDGVVGLYIGLMDNKKDYCIKVMLKELKPEHEKLIPQMLENYNVVLEVTGEIKPMEK